MPSGSRSPCVKRNNGQHRRCCVCDASAIDCTAFRQRQQRVRPCCGIALAKSKRGMHRTWGIVILGMMDIGVVIRMDVRSGGQQCMRTMIRPGGSSVHDPKRVSDVLMTMERRTHHIKAEDDHQQPRNNVEQRSPRQE